MDKLSCGNSATADHIAFHAAERPEAVAIVDDGREITYAQFHRDLGRFIRAVSALGLERGQSVAIAWGEIYPHWLMLLACEHLGMVAATFMPGEASMDSSLLARVDFVLSELRPSEVAPDRHRAITKPWLAGAFAREEAEIPAVADAEPDDPLRIVRTSGTTGAPKLMLLTRGMFEAWVERRIWSLGLTRRSRTLVNMSFAALGSYVLSTAMIRAGGTIIDTRGGGWEAMAHAGPARGITHARVTPLELKFLLDQLPPDFAKPAGLVLCTVGAAVSAALRERALDRFASEIIVSYGCNEVLFAAETRATGSEGISTIYPWVEMEVVDERDTPLPPGTAGRIRLRDPAMATGYLDDPETTAQKFRNGWFYPGDVGVVHGPHRIEIVGREDELLNLGGLKIAPSTLEALVQQHVKVDDVGVCTTRNAEGIEQVCIAVVNPGHSAAELMDRVTAAVRENVLGQFYLVRVPQIPRNANGKILRGRLREEIRAAIQQST